MKLRKHFLKLFFLSILLPSCSLKPQVITIEPIAIHSSKLPFITKNVTVTTTDSRPTPQIIGIRHENKSNIFQNMPQQIQKFFKQPEKPYINNYENISEKINKVAKEYLATQGFTISDGKTLEISLESLKYESIKKQNWYNMPRTKIRVYFTTNLKNEEGEITYKGQHEYTIEHTHPLFQPRSNTNESQINSALSEGIRRIFDDHNLLDALKK